MAMHASALVLVGSPEKKDTTVCRSQTKRQPEGLLVLSFGLAKPARGLFFVCTNADLHELMESRISTAASV